MTRASRFEGIPKTKLQASSASDPETLQSQVTKTARKRLSLRGLEVLHGRLLILLHQKGIESSNGGSGRGSPPPPLTGLPGAGLVGARTRRPLTILPWNCTGATNSV